MEQSGAFVGRCLSEDQGQYIALSPTDLMPELIYRHCHHVQMKAVGMNLVIRLVDMLVQPMGRLLYLPYLRGVVSGQVATVKR